MIKDLDQGLPVLYWFPGSAPRCPKCGNLNAMLDYRRLDDNDNWYEGFECRDCGFEVTRDGCTQVDIKMDQVNREYYGIASDGREVGLGQFLEENNMFRYLKDHPTPDTW
jgi:hypothetical protein